MPEESPFIIRFTGGTPPTGDGADGFSERVNADGAGVRRDYQKERAALDLTIDRDLTVLRLESEVKRLMLQGRFQEALPVLEQLLTLKPIHFEAMVLKGRCYLELADYPAALAALGEAELYEPTDLDVLEFKGLALMKLQEYSRAEKVYEEMLLYEPGDGYYQYLLACSAALQGKKRKALRELRNAAAEHSSFLWDAEEDPAFDGMRGMKAFRELLREKDGPAQGG